MFKFQKGIFFVLIFLVVQNCFAQTPTIKTFIDKDNILIGEHIKYKVVLTLPNQSFAANWFNLPDSLSHFELVEQSQLDSSVKEDYLIMQQTLTLTSFDSGVFKTPSFKIDIVNNGNRQIFFTDSIPILIGYAVADSTNQLRDIKPIIEVEDSSALWIIIAIVIVAVLLLVALIYFVIKLGSKKTILVKRNSLAAYDEAMQRLRKLKEFNFKDEIKTKKYYTELSTLLKHYISRKQNQSFYSSTTSDILLHCNSKNIMAEGLSALANTLRIGDAVKFAKYLPENNENEECWHTIKSTIERLEQKKL
jgi:type II secretory pathway pseudopilin PulG